MNFCHFLRSKAVWKATALLLVFAISVTNNSSTKVAEISRFTILHTNDEHANLIPYPQVDYNETQPDPTRGGIARLATLVDSIRTAKQRESVFLINAGDFMGGTPYSFLVMAGEAPELHLMQEIGYDMVTLGNHEFDYGPDQLATYLAAAKRNPGAEHTTVLSSNSYPPEDHPLSERDIRRRTMLESEDGLQVGFFGLLGEAAEQTAQLTDPVSFSDPMEEAAEQTATLREEGADVVIAVTHSGLAEDRQLARTVDGINLIVGGHSHDALHEPVYENRTPIVQAGKYLEHLGQLELEYHPERERLSVVNDQQVTPYLHTIDDRVAPDPDIRNLADDYADALGLYLRDWTRGTHQDVFTILAGADSTIQNTPAQAETPAGNLITDAMRIQTGEITDTPVDVAFQADGAIRDGFRPGTMPWSDGEIMFYDAMSVVGLGSGLDDRPGYPMVSTWLTGEELRRVMEISLLLSDLFGDAYFLQVSGLRAEYDQDRAILATIPFIDMPIPTNRGVLNLEYFTGEGIQEGGEFRKIERGEDDRLYHVAADYYIASFLPMVGELVPQLDLTLKDRDGRPTEVEDAIVHHSDGTELKMWETVAEYLQTFEPDEDGIPRVPAAYYNSDDRLMDQSTFPLWVWPLAILALLIAGVVYLIRWNRHRRANAG